VVTAEDVLEGKVQTGQTVVIADLQTYMKGLVTAEVLADQGKDVTVVMPYPIRGLAGNPYDMDGPTHTIQVINLTNKKVKRLSDFAVKKVSPGSAAVRNHYTEEVDDLEADTVVLSFWRKSRNGLFDELQGQVPELYRIGDCVSPRRYINAIEEGFNIGMQI
jgi:2,4-dienoyl-CoA reductase (NADPH2)